MRAAQEFSDIRRQHFMYWEAYEVIAEKLDELDEGTKAYIAKVPGTEYEFSLGTVAEFWALFDSALNRLSLEYTAGASMEELKALYPAAVDAFEAWCKASDNWHMVNFPEKRNRAIASPVELEVHHSYLEALRLLSLGVLLQEGDQIRRIAKLLWAERNEDTIIEELLSPFIADPDTQIETLLHKKLYDHLTAAIWGDTAQDSAKAMGKFLNAWYKYFKGAHWHNAHLRFGRLEDSPDWANYYGYWAWEAGAMAYLYELDDSSYRDHLIYPKDMVRWARAQGPVPKEYIQPASAAPEVIRAMPGEAIPRAGLWQTPAMLENRTLTLAAGETLPYAKTDKAGNTVVWFWKAEK